MLMEESSGLDKSSIPRVPSLHTDPAPCIIQSPTAEPSSVEKESGIWVSKSMLAYRKVASVL